MKHYEEFNPSSPESNNKKKNKSEILKNIC